MAAIGNVNDDEFEEFSASCDELWNLPLSESEQRLIQGLQREAEHMVSGNAGPPLVLNPLIRAAMQELELLQTEARRHAADRLQEILGAICEDDLVQADTATIFVLAVDRTLRTVATVNLQRASCTISVDGWGLLPQVVNCEEDRLVPNVDQEPDYCAVLDATQSEAAFKVQSANGAILGVVNVEFQRLRTMAELTMVQRRVHRDLGEIAVQLSVLKALSQGSSETVGWHPEIHGPDLQRVLTRLCHRCAQSIDQDQTQVTLWYAHPLKRKAFVFATSGSGYRFKTRGMVSLDATILGKHLLEARNRCVPYDPRIDNLVLTAGKPASMEGWLIGFAREAEQERLLCGHAGLLVTFRGRTSELVEASRRIIVQEALPALAKILGRCLQQFANLRIEIAETSLVYTARSHRRRIFESLLDAGLCSLSAEAGSVFIMVGERLKCVATTGLLATDGFSISDVHRRSGQDVSYCVVEDKDSWTMSVLDKKGKVVCVNETSSPYECRLAGLRERPRSRFREVLKSDDDDEVDHRRFLAVAIVVGGCPVGVIRLVRSLHQKPFTLCEEDLITRIAKIGALIVKPHLTGEPDFPTEEIVDVQACV